MHTGMPKVKSDLESLCGHDEPRAELADSANHTTHLIFHSAVDSFTTSTARMSNHWQFAFKSGDKTP